MWAGLTAFLLDVADRVFHRPWCSALEQADGFYLKSEVLALGYFRMAAWGVAWLPRESDCDSIPTPEVSLSVILWSIWQVRPQWVHLRPHILAKLLLEAPWRRYLETQLRHPVPREFSPSGRWALPEASGTPTPPTCTQEAASDGLHPKLYPISQTFLRCP